LARTNDNKLVCRCEFANLTMVADRIKFRQVLLNLLSNACKFTENGTVHLDVALSDTFLDIDHKIHIMSNRFIAFSQ
jgi:signal transduction histidine kinase